MCVGMCACMRVRAHTCACVRSCVRDVFAIYDINLIYDNNM